MSDTAVSRLYYAAFYAVNALLTEKRMAAKYQRLFSKSGFHNIDFIKADVCCENPTGTQEFT